MQIVKTAQSNPATAQPALNDLFRHRMPQAYSRDTFSLGLPRQPIPRAKACALTIPKALILDLEPLVLPAAALGVGGLVTALALKTQRITPKNGHKMQPLAPEDKTDWSELAKWAGPIVAVIIFSLNLNQQIGALSAGQTAILSRLGAIENKLDGLDGKVDALSREVSYLEGAQNLRPPIRAPKTVT